MRSGLRGPVLASLLLVAGLGAGLASPALASGRGDPGGARPGLGWNGVPVDVFLSYLPDVSNWGPRGATGRGVVAVADAYVELDIEGLRPQAGHRYWVWLEDEDGRPWAVGSFQAKARGPTSFLATGLELPDLHYQLIFLTLEAEGKEDGGPGTKVSIAGRFPNAAAVKPSAAEEASERPQTLPETGGRWSGPPAGLVEVPAPVWAIPAALAVALAVLGARRRGGTGRAWGSNHRSSEEDGR